MNLFLFNRNCAKSKQLVKDFERLPKQKHQLHVLQLGEIENRNRLPLGEQLYPVAQSLLNYNLPAESKYCFLITRPQRRTIPIAIPLPPDGPRDCRRRGGACAEVRKTVLAPGKRLRVPPSRGAAHRICARRKGFGEGTRARWIRAGACTPRERGSERDRKPGAALSRE